MVVAKGRTERDVACGPGGLKAGAGLRGPYGTSVRHTWPTWILLIPTVTLISTSLFFFFLFLSRHSLPSSQRSSPFSISLSAQMYTRVLFSFHSTHRYLVLQPAVILSLRPQSSFIPKSLVFLSVYSALYTYASYHPVNVFPIFQSHP